LSDDGLICNFFIEFTAENRLMLAPITCRDTLAEYVAQKMADDTGEETKLCLIDDAFGHKLLKTYSPQEAKS